MMEGTRLLGINDVTLVEEVVVSELRLYEYCGAPWLAI